MADALAGRDPNGIRDAAHDILSRPEFAQPRERWWDKLFAVVLDPVGSLVSGYYWLLDHFPGGSAGSIIAWAVAGVAIVVVCYGVFRLTRSVTPDVALPVTYVPGPGSATVDELLKKASELEEAGEWTLVIGVLYRAAITRLGVEGIVRHVPGKTTGEYLAEVATNLPTGREAFAAATSLFEWVWYGNGSPSSSDVANFRHLVDDVGARVAA